MLVRGALASAQAFRVLHRVLSAAGVHRQFPGLQPLDDMVGVFEDRAGVLFPELCITALHARAIRNGAEVRLDEKVLAWKADGDGVVVEFGVPAVAPPVVPVDPLVCAYTTVAASASTTLVPTAMDLN